jgi:hypothetical protein
VDAARELAQLLDRPVQLVGDPADLPLQLGQLRGHGGLGQAQLEAERDWVPSCRSRSIRRRASSAAATIRARDAVSWARLSALRSLCRRAR